MPTQILDRASGQSGADAALALTLTPATKHAGCVLMIYSVEVAGSATMVSDVISITRTAHTGTAADDRVIFTATFSGDDFVWSPASDPVMDLYIMPDEALVVNVAAIGSGQTSFAFIYYEVIG